MTAARPVDSSLRETRWVWWCAGLLIAGSTLPAVRAYNTIAVRAPLDPNEGWNAYHVWALSRGGPLYPSADALFVNNYPPLSFYVLRGVSAFGVDPIAAGRAVSLASLVLCAVLAVATLRRLGAAASAAWLGGAVTLASFFLYTHYAGICDPQLLAHAVAMLALYLGLRRTPTRLSAYGSGGLFALSLFVKHNIVAVPFAFGAWLLYRRARHAASWWLGLASVSVALAAVCVAFYGAPFIHGLLASREFVAMDVFRSAGSWSAKLAPLVVLTAVGARGSDEGRLFAWLGACAFVVGAVAQGGAGVDSNALFECLLILALAAAFAAHRARGPAKAVALAASLLPFVYGAIRHSKAEWLDAHYWLTPRQAEARAAQVEIEQLRSLAGSAICTELALCFWAGKPDPVDAFNLGQQLAKRARSAEDTYASLARRADAAIQLRDGGPSLLGADVRAWGYELDHAGPYGAIFRRR